jgi:hypothetical protein
MDIKVLQAGTKDLGPTPLASCCNGNEHSCGTG